MKNMIWRLTLNALVYQRSDIGPEKNLCPQFETSTYPPGKPEAFDHHLCLGSGVSDNVGQRMLLLKEWLVEQGLQKLPV